MPKSLFIHGQEVTPSVLQFEKWLVELGYSSALESYPFSVRAESLVGDYLTERLLRKTTIARISHHAEDIGWVSDYEITEPPNDDVE